jgi:2,4-dienoyl-CoA reductase-like NADH-dependent reductase (Old Yellow Enzyme family)
LTFTEHGFEEVSTPRALKTDEIDSLIGQYEHAAVMAMAAGFDGVEVHSANSYLLDQFIRDSTNRRTDKYGGSVQNRIRLTLEVVERVVGVIGAGRAGIRLSPTTPNAGRLRGRGSSRQEWISANCVVDGMMEWRLYRKQRLYARHGVDGPGNRGPSVRGSVARRRPGPRLVVNRADLVEDVVGELHGQLLALGQHTLVCGVEAGDPLVAEAGPIGGREPVEVNATASIVA